MKSKKLQLDRETISTLNEEQSAQVVAAGGGRPSNSCFCSYDRLCGGPTPI